MYYFEYSLKYCKISSWNWVSSYRHGYVVFNYNVTLVTGLFEALNIYVCIYSYITSGFRFVHKLVNVSAKVEHSSSVMCFDVETDEPTAWNSALRFIELLGALMPEHSENYWQFLIIRWRLISPRGRQFYRRS